MTSPNRCLHFIRQRFKGGASRQGDLLFLGILGLLIFSSGFGLRDPWPADEPRYALIAKEMVTSGDWFFPRRAGELYPDKPPLFLWSIAGFYLLTGSMRSAFLVPSLLAGLGTLLLTYDLGSRLWHRRVGLYAALALLLIFQFPLLAKGAQIDAFLCFWTTLGLYGLLRHLLIAPNWRWYCLGSFAMGLGVITKGVGFLPAFLLIPYIYCRWRSWRRLPTDSEKGQWRWLLGPAFFLSAICLWFIPMMILVRQSGDPALMAYQNNILWRQTAQRYASSWHHIKPAWYYLVSVIPWAWFPLNFGLPWYIPAWRWRLQRKDARYFLLLVWILLVLLFFSVSPGKRGVYLLPIAPALALVTAPLIAGLLRKVAFQKTAWRVTLFLVALFIVISFAGMILNTPLNTKVEALGASPWKLTLSVGLAGLLILFFHRKERGVLALGYFFIAVWLFYGWMGYPLFNSGRSPASFMAEVGQRLGPKRELAMVKFKEQFILHADRPVTHFGYRQADHKQEITAAHWLREKEGRVLMVPKQNMAQCFMIDKSDYLGLRHGRAWYMVGREALGEACGEATHTVKRFTTRAGASLLH